MTRTHSELVTNLEVLASGCAGWREKQLSSSDSSSTVPCTVYSIRSTTILVVILKPTTRVTIPGGQDLWMATSDPGSLVESYHDRNPIVVDTGNSISDSEFESEFEFS